MVRIHPSPPLESKCAHLRFLPYFTMHEFWQFMRIKEMALKEPLASEEKERLRTLYLDWLDKTANTLPTKPQQVAFRLQAVALQEWLVLECGNPDPDRLIGVQKEDLMKSLDSIITSKTASVTYIEDEEKRINLREISRRAKMVISLEDDLRSGDWQRIDSIASVFLHKNGFSRNQLKVLRAPTIFAFNMLNGWGPTKTEVKRVEETQISLEDYFYLRNVQQSPYWSHPSGEEVITAPGAFSDEEWKEAEKRAVLFARELLQRDRIVEERKKMGEEGRKEVAQIRKAGKYIKRIRETKGIPEAVVADALEKDKSFVHFIEGGYVLREEMTSELRKALAKVLRIDESRKIDKIFGYEEI